MNKIQTLAAVIFFMTSPVVFGEDTLSPHVATVHQFVAAFNAQDSGAMANLVSDDVEWLSISGKQVSVDASGRNNLVDSMNGYFESCPSCRSELTNVVSTSNRVSAVEMASWQADDGRRSQKAMSVYEFSNGLIARVYYFPAEQ